MVMTAIDMRRDGHDYDLHLRMAEIWRKASPLLLYGDYYPLTPFSNTDDTWTVRQFSDHELGVGLLHGMRHRACTQESITVRPSVFHPDSVHVFENPETDAVLELSGATLLRDGFTFELPARSAAMWLYRVRD